MPNSNIVTQDIASLLDGWIEAEQNGVQFPVPFDLAWRIAGYSKKANAKQSGLKGLQKDKEFSCEISKNALAGRPSDSIMLSVDGMKHMCIMACTYEGRQIRDYFIEAEKKWRLVQQVAPQVANEVEIMQLKIELAKIEKQRAALEDKTISLRHYVVTALPQAVADRILGVTEVTKVITKEVVVSERGEVLGHVPGETMNKRELCERYGIVTRTGNPDYKQLNAFLGGLNLPPDAFIDRQVVTHNAQLKVEYLPQLEAWIKAKPSQRNLGE